MVRRVDDGLLVHRLGLRVAGLLRVDRLRIPGLLVALLHWLRIHGLRGRLGVGGLLRIRRLRRRLLRLAVLGRLVTHEALRLGGGPADSTGGTAQ